MRLLLVTSKNPILCKVCKDYDGGSILVKQLLKFSQKNNYQYIQIDILLIREKEANFNKNNNQKIIFLSPIRFNQLSRFEERMANTENTCHKIRELSEIYDIILIQHISNAFGIETLPLHIQKKIIILPMFCGISYIQSGELIPESYVKYEINALKACRGIITPSQAEFNQLTNFYKINSFKIKKVHRGIDLKIYCYKSRNLNSEKIQLLYIATIKKQKNQIDCIEILNELNKKNIKSRLHFVGGIGDDSYYNFLTEQIEKFNLMNQVYFYNVVPPDYLAKIAYKCHFAISVSQCETFGRGIYEGMATGLPTLAYKDISCLWENLKDGNGIHYVNREPSAIAKKIKDIWDNKIYYKTLSELAYQSALPFEEYNAINLLFDAVIAFNNDSEEHNERFINTSSNHSQRGMV